MQKEKIYNCKISNDEYLEDENKREINLEYYLILNEKEGMYGVEIQKVETNIQGNKFVENSMVMNYSENKDKALELIDKLSRNTVTPVSLNEIIDDT